jgi:hypothetical protein
MLETTRDFFSDAFSRKLEGTHMLDIVLTITGIDDPMPIGQVIYEFHKLTPKQRNYVCCVLLERDQDPLAWHAEWSRLESEAFE